LIRSPSNATDDAPRPARDWPVPKSDLGPARKRARKLGLQAIAQGSEHKWEPLGTTKRFIWKLVRTFLRNPEDRHRHTRQTHRQTDAATFEL